MSCLQYNIVVDVWFDDFGAAVHNTIYISKNNET